MGHGYFKRKKNEELRKRWRDLQETDGSLSARVIPPLGKRDMKLHILKCTNVYGHNIVSVCLM